MVDAEILCHSGISTEIWRPNDFSSDPLVLKLESYESVQKIHRQIFSGVSDNLACDVV